MRRVPIVVAVLAQIVALSAVAPLGASTQTEDPTSAPYQHPPGLGPQEAIAQVSAPTWAASQAERADARRAALAAEDGSPGVNVRTTNSAGTQAEISMAATGGGGQNIVITYNGGPNGLGFVSSQDGGRTFQAEQSPPTPAGSNPCCDPSVVADNVSSFFLIQLFRDDGANVPAAGNCTNSLHVSTDGGQTFSSIVSSPFSYPPGGPDFPDQPHIGIDRANPNNLYVFTRHFTSGVNCPQTGGGGTVQGEVVCSNDGGATWSNPFVFPQFTDTAHLDVAPDGTAYIVGNGIGTNMGTTRVILWRATATTCPGAGNTPNFGGPTVVADNLTFGNVGIDREFPQPTVLADPTNSNRAYVNFSADSTQGSGDREAFLSRCDFPAGTCTALLTVNDNAADGSDQYFPMACVDPATNNVFVSWNDDRSGQEEIRATTVTNNGTTTGASQRVSDVTWPIINPGGTPDYGDYNENNGACRARHHYAAWSSQVSAPGIMPPSTDIDVFFTVVNEPPEADAGGPYMTVEGTDVALSGSATDPENDTPFTFEWDLDDDGLFDDATGQTPTFPDVGQDGVFPICLRVTDSVGDADEDCTTVTVVNVPPSLSGLAQDGPKPEGDAVTITGTVTDPGWEEMLTATIDWGDGTPVETISGVLENDRPDATLEFSGSHVYGDNGTFSVEVCGHDDDTQTCQMIDVTFTNVPPTVGFDLTGTEIVNGVPTVIGEAGQPVELTGRATDPGSDDLFLRWDFGDGSPIVLVTSLVNPPLPDPPNSPSVQPRDVTDTQSHTYGDACIYEATFSATDDDGGASGPATIAVLIAGNGDRTRPTGWWHRQYMRGGARADFDLATLECYLAIARFGSAVFDEATALSDLADAEDALDGATPKPHHLGRFDRELLTAWLNLANGAVAFDEPVLDANGDGTLDTTFGEVVAGAEAVRLDPTSTRAEVASQQRILHRINVPAS